MVKMYKFSVGICHDLVGHAGFLLRGEGEHLPPPGHSLAALANHTYVYIRNNLRHVPPSYKILKETLLWYICLLFIHIESDLYAV